MPSAVWFTRTTDYGRTFTPPVPVTTATGDGAYTWQGNLVAASSGRDLYLAYARRQLPFHPPTPHTVALAASHDGGATWTSHPIASLPQGPSMYPSVAIDAGGWLHAVWAAVHEAGMPVFYTMSKNGGTTWSPPRQLNPDETARGPWVAGGAKGQARVAWLGTHPGDTGRAMYFHYAKVDNGRTVATGTTTTRPIWQGSEPGVEFEAVRLDRHGRMHLAMAVYDEEPGAAGGSDSWWAFYYQRENPRR